MLTTQNINDIISLLKTAGIEILRIYHNDDFQTKLKEDQSPVTIADLTSDKIIKTGLKKITPSIPVFSEETKEVPYDIRSSWNPLWILDPLDGTKEFIGRNAEFCICLALILDGKPIAGFIYAPVKDEFWYALAGKGAFKIGVNQHYRLPLKNPSGNMIIAVSRSHHNKNEVAWIESFRKKHTSLISIVGSAIKFCRIAEGNADLYPKFGTINEWDVAAGNIIVEESGGEMVELATGSPPVYNKEDYIQPYFVVWGKRLKGSPFDLPDPD
jgi:3'(2'), 5'-bisphosphate nucleotidase